MKKSHRKSLIAMSLMVIHTNLHANCWASAGKKYGLDPWLIYSIAQQESRLNPQAVNINRNGTTDLGLMQINTIWLPTLQKYGIRRNDLFDACTSIHVGAWILSQNVASHGNNWTAVGAYNAGSSKKMESIRRRYAQKVLHRYSSNLRKFMRNQHQQSFTKEAEITTISLTE